MESYPEDRGCEYGEKCVECPFEMLCIMEEANGAVSYLKRVRDEEIQKLKMEGYTVKSLSVIFSCSEATIFRSLGSYGKYEEKVVK